MQNIIESRIDKVQKSFFNEEIDTFMIVVQENRHYLSGFNARDTGNESAGVLFITDSDLILATDSRFKLQAEIQAPIYEIFCYKKGIVKEFPEILERLKTKRLGFESERTSYSDYQKMSEQIKDSKVELKPVRGIVENLRKKKSEAEIRATKSALAVAEHAFKQVSENIRLGMTERAAAWKLEKKIRESGADALSFPVICASGPNSAMPHYISGDRKFQKNEPILFDWGARLNGYCSDTTRTLVIGKPDKKFQNIYQTVQSAQSIAIEAIRPGVSSKAVDNIARSYINDRGYKENFGHGLGHGTGLAIHEAPSLGPLTDTILEPGMLVTVEPGIYLPGWGGIRIENQVVVRENGAEILNNLSVRK
jgi:Xaa-Pro aminopeptidase